MPVICPAILAATEEDYRQQINKIVHLAHRVHIDLSDGHFAPTATIKPEQAWWPVGFKADFHLMYHQPMATVRSLMQHRPSLVIVHAEADGDFNELASFCHEHGVKVGIALLAPSPVEAIAPALPHIDHVLIFSGKLGHFGGLADIRLLEKIQILKQLKPSLEIGWDGGVNDQNIAELVSGGVEVLNVGGYIQKAEDPARAFTALQRIADEVGTT